METVTVVVPGTTANLGPGFDCLGAALTLHNQFQFALAERLHIEVTGLEAERVQTDETNLAYQSFAKLYAHLGQPVPAVHLAIHLGVPAARGLGSSATAIIGGLLGANALTGNRLSQRDLMNLAIAIEGHPDNVVPALLGGCQLTASGNSTASWEVCPINWHPEVVPVVAIPNFELSTAEARRVLPTTYSRADAIFNVAHLGLLLRGLETAHSEWLQVALQDRIHQPYRESLILGYQAVRSAALEAGAMGLVISGAGPTLLALATPGKAPVVQTAIASAWKAEGIAVDVKVLAIDRRGAHLK